MYFIFRHSKKSNYKDKIGKYYHYTKNSPNYEKVRKGSKVLIYVKEINAIIGKAEIREIKKFWKNNVLNFYAIYKNYKKFKNPIFCDYDFLEKCKIKYFLDGKLPGIIPISKETYKKILSIKDG